LEGSRAGVLAGGTVHSQDSSSIILLAGEVYGNVETVLDTRGALIAGMAAGMSAGVLLLLGTLLRRRR